MGPLKILAWIINPEEANRNPFPPVDLGLQL